MRGVLKPLVAVEEQLCGDRFFCVSSADSIQDEMYRLPAACFVSNDTIVKQIPND